MIKKVLSTFLVYFLLNTSLSVKACTIFMANDGQNVWVGNNEDELQKVKYRMWFYPAQSTYYGFAIWTELSLGELFNKFSYLNPQGGLNEFGLFMDYTSINEIKVVNDHLKTTRKKQW